jgi:NitT/TauT family transport system substrate-binding protein
VGRCGKILAGALGIFAFFVQTPNAARTYAAEPVTLRLAASPVDGIVPVLYAQRAGLFAKAGLNVTVDRMSGGAVSSAIAGGAADLGKASTVGIITAHAHGIPLTIVAPSAIYDPKTPDAVLAVKADSAIASPRDLVGKTVAISTIGDISQVAVQSWLEQNGIDSHATQFVEIGIPATAVALEQGRVAAGVLIKPFVSETVDSGKAKVLSLVYSAIAPRFLESVWYGNRSFMESNRKAVAAFQRVVAQASRYANAHTEETADLLAAFTGIDPQRAAHMPRIVTGETVDARDIQPVIDAMVRTRLLEKPFDAREIIWR